MFKVTCEKGNLGLCETYKEAQELWASCCNVFHNQAQETKNNKEAYNYWVNCFNTLKIVEE